MNNIEAVVKVKCINPEEKDVSESLILELPMREDEIEEVMKPYQGWTVQIESVEYYGFDVDGIKFSQDDNVFEINELFDELNIIEERNIDTIYACAEEMYSIDTFDQFYNVVMNRLYLDLEYVAPSANEYIHGLLELYEEEIYRLPIEIREAIDKKKIKSILSRFNYFETKYGYYRLVL